MSIRDANAEELPSLPFLPSQQTLFSYPWSPTNQGIEVY